MKKRFILSVLADVLFVIGMVAIVVGIAMAGYIPHAVCAAGGELIASGLFVAVSLRNNGGD